MAAVGDVNGDGYDDFAVGAPGSRNADTPGAIHIFLGTADGPDEQAAWALEGALDDQRFGVMIAAAGDVDGDGYADLLVGTALGRQFYLYYGGPNELPRSPIALEPAPEGHTQRRTAHGVGDVNGDGYNDVVTGTVLDQTHYAVHLYPGTPDGLNPSPILYVVPVTARSPLTNIRGMGDLDGDGYADMAIGLAGIGPFERGKVELWYGSADGLSPERAGRLIGPTDSDHFGVSVAAAGDVNGDGYGDLFVGAPMARDPSVFRQPVKSISIMARQTDQSPRNSSGRWICHRC